MKCVDEATFNKILSLKEGNDCYQFGDYEFSLEKEIFHKEINGYEYILYERKRIGFETKEHRILYISHSSWMFLEVLNKEKTQIAHCCFTQENEIYNLFVVESCRRKHIATNIMLILKEKVFPYYNKIWLRVGGENSENNFRFSFYEKFGFVRRKNEKKVNYHIYPRMDYIGEKNERDRIAS